MQQQFEWAGLQAFLFSQNGSVQAIHHLHDLCQCTQSLGFRRTSRISASLELSSGVCMYSHLQGEGKLTQSSWQPLLLLQALFGLELPFLRMQSYIDS